MALLMFEVDVARDRESVIRLGLPTIQSHSKSLLIAWKHNVHYPVPGISEWTKVIELIWGQGGSSRTAVCTISVLGWPSLLAVLASPLLAAFMLHECI